MSERQQQPSLIKSIEERIEYLIKEDDSGCADRVDELKEVLFWMKENGMND